ncbi:UbiA family prenyltransferase [Methanolacinia petrolearia]|uniref:UbiA family prenyltransferase n=1 Tax=Methanolacinia petrolearia TaxID=54120 RepID=UPI003BA88066
MHNIALEKNIIIPDFSRIIQTLIYSSLYLSFAGGAMVFLLCSLQDLAFSPVAALIMILVTYGVYNLNRKTDEAEDMMNHYERYHFTKKHGSFLYRSSILSYITAAGIGMIYGTEALFMTLLPLIAGILYIIPIFPKSIGFSRIKEVPVLKSLIVALAWAIPPAFLPVYLSSTLPGFSTYIVALFFFILVFTSKVVFDIRDVKGDIASGVRTIPAMLGKERTVVLLSVLNISAGLVIVYFGLEGLPSPQVLFLLLSMVYVQCYLIYSLRENITKMIYEIFIDGKFIILMGVYALLCCLCI